MILSPRITSIFVSNVSISDSILFCWKKENCTSFCTFTNLFLSERNGRKTLTTVQGLPKEYSPKALLKAFKKEYGIYPLSPPFYSIRNSARLSCISSRQGMDLTPWLFWDNRSANLVLPLSSQLAMAPSFKIRTWGR